MQQSGNKSIVLCFKCNRSFICFDFGNSISRNDRIPNLCTTTPRNGPATGNYWIHEKTKFHQIQINACTLRLRNGGGCPQPNRSHFIFDILVVCTTPSNFLIHGLLTLSVHEARLPASMVGDRAGMGRISCSGQVEKCEVLPTR